MTDHPVVVTLHDPITVPATNHYPSDTTVFRCQEHSEGDEFFTFFELNIGPDHTVATVDADNVRSIVTLDIFGGDDE